MEYELYHHGVKGMRWGVRRAARRQARYANASEDAREVSKLKKKKPYEMSNAELKRLNERKRLEQEYSRLNPSSFKKGVAFVTAAAGLMGTVLNVYNNSDKIVKAGKKVGDSIFSKVGDAVIKDIKF